MVKYVLMILILSFLLGSSAFAIKTSYNQMGYYNTFYQTYLEQQGGKKIIQSSDSSKQALIPEAGLEKQNEEKLKSNEGEVK